MSGEAVQNKLGNVQRVHRMQNNTANAEYLECAFRHFTQDSKFSPYPSNSITIGYLRLCCCNTVKMTAIKCVLAVDGTQSLFQIPCILQYPVHYNTLYITTNCILQHPVHYNTCTLQHPVHYNTLYITIPCTLQQPVYYNTLYITTPCTLQHPVHYNTL